VHHAFNVLMRAIQGCLHVLRTLLGVIVFGLQRAATAKGAAGLQASFL
jgi:uncharacterized membrane protein YesL